MEGIIVVNKPKGITSFDVIRKLKKILKTKKIGHTGTLDPLATGVMLVCVGRATKLASDLEVKDKVYIADFDIGYATDTYDIEGKKIAENIIEVSKENLEQSIKKFIGNIKQVPPMYSAIKIDGNKLYHLARKGIEVERPERNVTIEYINLLDFKDNKAKIEKNITKFTADLLKIENEANEKLLSVGNAEVISLSENLQYFLNDMNIYTEYVDYDSVTAENVAKLIKDKGIKVVVSDRWLKKNVIKALKDAGGEFVIINTLDIPMDKDGKMDPEAILKGFKENTDNLIEALAK